MLNDDMDGIDLAGALYAGEVSAAELMRAALEAASTWNPSLNALRFVKAESAIAQAAQATLRGTFGGLPFLLKDSGLASTDLPSSIGSRLFTGGPSEINATLTDRFTADGFVPFGRTTVPEFCMAPTTEAIANGGPTRNPYDLTRSSGGSSGGAAAAVAARIVPIAHGSDGGGSIRIPASCCGVFGLKPSRGLVPYGPQRGEGWGGLAADGVLSRSVRDSAAALDGIAGMELGQPYAAPPRPDSYRSLLHVPFERPLRIARWTQAWDDIPIAAQCIAATDEAERALTSLGHEVEQVPPPSLKYSSFINAIIDVMSASVTSTVNGYLRQNPVTDLSAVLEPAILDAYERGSSLTAERYVLAINRFHAIGRTLANYMRNYDVLLTPTLTQLPAKLGELSMNTDFATFRHQAGRYTPFLAIINASGQPAANVPLSWTDDGIPVGVQLIGRFGDESTLLRLSAQLEQTVPWHHRRPPVAA